MMFTADIEKGEKYPDDYYVLICEDVETYAD